MSKDMYYPKTKEEFEAYCRAVDEANAAIVANAEKTSEAQPE